MDSRFDSLRDLGGRGLHTGWESLGGFRKFILRGNVVDLAVGIVIGAAFTSVVTGFVKDFITPLIGWFIKLISGPTGFNPKTFASATWQGFAYGDLITVILSFFIIAFVVYFFVVKPVTALQDRMTARKPAEAPTTRDCPFCLSTVPLKATRCAYCTAQLPPADQSFQPVNQQPFPQHYSPQS
ncbi:MAG TPA: large conductance mechanosensitive channel protein MscL [Ktedonobacteraceae bacterium]|nr:large conductance mechanosensitive channel protein MscL [Ktedonobacteraceae bacterium]